MKLLMLIATINWSNCTVLCVKKDRIIGKDMTSWFFSTTTYHHTRQQWLTKTTWRHSTRKLCYPIPLTHQTWHLLTILCFRRWATRSLSGTSILTKTSENGLMSASKDEEFFWCGIDKLHERWEKCIVNMGKYFE